MPARDYYLPQRRLVSQDDAAMIESPQVPRSRFTGSWNRLTTFDAGYLVPFLLDEILPGDHMKYDVTAYVRMSTPLFPLMMNQRVDTHFFYVPNRLLWANWVRMMGEQEAPTDSIEYTIPQILSQAGGYQLGSIFDHFGLPTEEQIAGVITYSHSALPLRAYNLIYNAWFRDQNLQASIYAGTGDGPDLYTSFALKRRAKSHDYFTSALPWPQKFTGPTVPLGGMAPVVGIGALSQTPAGTSSGNVFETGGITTTYPFYSITTGNFLIEQDAAASAYPAIYADLSLATGVAINTLRQAWLVQSLLERDARGGTRYVELIRSHFGVTNPDFRLQRPEYIGGGQTPLQITPVAQTAPAADDSVVGALGAAGTAAGNHHASYAATEHGYILGLISVKSELAYQQGMHRMWAKLTRYDFYWPALAGLGEQAILRGEIFKTGDTDDAIVFGYQERWHEYRTRYSEVTGVFKSGVTGTMDAWHLAQQFGTAPTLGPTFIQDTPPMDRILAAGETAELQQYLADIMISRTAVRPVSMFGTPAQLGRF